MKPLYLLVMGGLVAGMAFAQSDREEQARDLVAALYAEVAAADVDALELPYPERYFFALQEQAIPAQEMMGYLRTFYPLGTVCDAPEYDPDNPEFRGMITIRQQCEGQAPLSFELRSDPDQPGAPIRIMRINLSDE